MRFSIYFLLTFFADRPILKIVTTYRYKNTTDQDLTLVGVIAAGKTIESDEKIDNPNLELLSDKPKKVYKEDGDEQ